MMKHNSRYITTAAMIAALYVVLTMIANALGLASQAIQLRFSEALTVLPYFTAAAVPGLAVGCLLSNVLAGGVIIDVIFGTIATLLGALGTYALRKYKYAAPLPPIIANTLIIPFVLKYGYHIDELWYSFLTVGAGELLSCGVLGLLLLTILQKYKKFLF
ncbi:MAG: QueT transporter family protein [Lachnospiraceae bacterium]